MGTWGGKREGSGRPKGARAKGNYEAKRRSFYCSDEEWRMVTEAAEARGISATEWIRRAVWKTNMATGESIDLIKPPW